ncbi:hypothetical protein [Streptomyces liliifuscus]|uniref:Uncharacterized protein n=1 Tax=Streptomyces liliifuscus TaxID=2797636 RepID=A0A7T7L2G9_9ACTN|nr:hypothetical protein [Streptomyces liliifuscus]QQM45230.1 hypothetical protein JEQ17_41365 [Streptomyces liliifuscus]
MTTATAVTVDWVRLAIGDDEITVEPSPGIELALSVKPVEHDGYLDPLTRGPAPRLHLSLHLIPTGTEAIVRCESQARRILEQLGAPASACAPMCDFSLEAALGGEGLPYNRASAPGLTLTPGEPPVFDEDLPVPSVHVFTAKAHGASETVYTMWLAD